MRCDLKIKYLLEMTIPDYNVENQCVAWHLTVIIQYTIQNNWFAHALIIFSVLWFLTCLCGATLI